MKQSPRFRARALAVAAALVGLVAAVPAVAQSAPETDAARQERFLRQASTLEAAGDLGGAEAIVRALLREDPGAVSVLLALERLLRMQGREEELIPLVRAYLHTDPGSAFGHHLLLRSYAAAGRLDEMDRAAEAWIQSDSDTETPYREVARIWEDRGDLPKARSVLERGRRAIGAGDALALELGVVSARVGDLRRAVTELDRAVGDDARGLMLVRRQISLLPDAGAAVLEPLARRLLDSPTTLERRRAAAELAVDAGLDELAQRAAAGVAGDLAQPERAGFLVEVGRRADGAGLRPLAYWAFSALLPLMEEGSRSLAVRSRLAALALAMGDTALARENYRALEEEYAPGSAERRQAVALRIELTAREGDLDAAMVELREFKTSYPGAPELDGLSATLGELLLDAGRTDAAGDLLERVAGPRASLARGRLALVGGDLDRARSELMRAAPALQGAEATETIALLTLLDRLGNAGARVLAEGMSELAADRPSRAVDALVAGASGLPQQEGAAILELAAGMADRQGMPSRSEAARRQLVEDHAHAPEVPAALLALARALAERPEGRPEARALLERLILEHPRSALVPQARRELDRIARRVPTS